MSEQIKLEELMDAKELAPILGITPFLLARMAKNKKVPAIKIGNRWLFCKDKVEKFISEKMGEIL